MGDMAGFTGHHTVVAVMGIPFEKICGLGDKFLADMAFETNLITVGHGHQIPIFINGVISQNIFNPATHLSRNWVIMAVFTGNIRLIMDIIQIIAGEVRSNISIHNMAGRAKFRAGIG